MGKCYQSVTISALAFFSQIPQVKLQESCTDADYCLDTNWVHLWYIWLVVAIGGLLILCGVVCFSIRCCCLNHPRPAGERRPQPYEVTVIAFDQDSTLQSTISSLHSMFGPAARKILAVAHSHNAVPAAHHPAGVESPPVYEEALHMARFTVARSRERAPDLEPVPKERQVADAEKGNPHHKPIPRDEAAGPELDVLQNHKGFLTTQGEPNKYMLG